MWGEKMELRILDAIQRLHNPALDWLMCFITGFGNFGVFWLLVAVVLMVIPRTRRIGVTVFIGLLLCDGILKNLAARPRPCDVNKTVHMLVARPFGWSFPSGHSASSFTMASAVWFSGRRKAGGALFVLFPPVSVCALSKRCAVRRPISAVCADSCMHMASREETFCR